MKTVLYHQRRELAELAMARDADSLVAQIVHTKLAVLHHASVTAALPVAVDPGDGVSRKAS